MNNPSDFLSPVSKDEVSDFFISLGYEVTWDFKRSTGETWYEIIKGGYLVCQIDQGVPLKYIIRDFCCWHQGKEPSQEFPNDDVNYKVNGPNSPELRELFKKVYETCRRLWLAGSR